MEHDKFKNGSTVRFNIGSLSKIGTVKSYNPGGPGIFTVLAQGQRHPYYLYEAEIVATVPPEEVKKAKLVRALEKILEAACDNPLTSNGPYVLVNRNATNFSNIVHKALLELTEEDQEGTI